MASIRMCKKWSRVKEYLARYLSLRDIEDLDSILEAYMRTSIPARYVVIRSRHCIVLRIHGFNMFTGVHDGVEVVIRI